METVIVIGSAGGYVHHRICKREDSRWELEEKGEDDTWVKIHGPYVSPQESVYLPRPHRVQVERSKPLGSTEEINPKTILYKCPDCKAKLEVKDQPQTEARCSNCESEWSVTFEGALANFTRTKKGFQAGKGI